MGNATQTKGENYSVLKGRRSYGRLILRVGLYFLLGVWLLKFNPYGLNDRADEITQQTLYRLFAPLYQFDARDNIVVVLLTPEGIENLHDRGLLRANTWPIQYRDHGYILSRVMKASPHAVFIDVLFERERATDDSLGTLVTRLKHDIEKTQTAVFFASGFSVSRLTPVQKQLITTGAQPVITGWESLGEIYPLTASDTASLACKDTPCQRPSAALALYESYCLHPQPRAGCNRSALLALSEVPAYLHGDPSATEGLSIYWGSEPPNPEFARDTIGQCEQGASGLWEGLWRVSGNLLGGLVGDDAARPLVPCPYHQFITADYLVTIMRNGTDAEKKALDKLLRGKNILYGLKLEGVDTFVSPVHGQLPGVYLHAMALDNLMSFGAKYIRGSVANAELFNLGSWFILVIIYAWGVRWLEHATDGTCQFNTADSNLGKKENSSDSFWVRHCNSLLNKARAHPKSAMSVLLGLLVVSVALGMFLIMRLEPVNSIAFLGLLAMLNVLRGSPLEQWILKIFGLDLPQPLTDITDNVLEDAQ